MELVSSEQALCTIRPQQEVFVQGGAATPTLLLEQLAARARAASLHDIGVIHLHSEGPAPHLAADVSNSIRHRALFIAGNSRQAVNEGRADYIPVFLSDIPLLFARRHISLDVALINVSPPDRHGYCSLGTSVDITLAGIRAAKTVVAEINQAMPRTHGDSFIHLDQIDFGVAVNRPPYEVQTPIVGEIEKRIGQYIAERVPDGATLQLGIGAIPAAVAAALGDKRHLGIHTEMFTDTIVDLIERGVITGTEKELNRGRVVACFVMGSARLYRFIDDNPAIELRPADYTNDTGVIRRFRKMVAINSAIEVDLTGQVCADSIGTLLYSGVGGQMDFIRGAALAEEGQAIIALPATVHGTRSRIVPLLQPGAGVVTTRAHVHTIVTEYGVADLHGKSLRERAKALISIAAPQFRDELTHQATVLHRL